MSKNVQRIIWIVLMAPPLLMLVMSGIMKITGNPQVVEGLTKFGLGNYILLLGVTELVSVILFIIPKTYKIGFLLVNAYLGGAFAAELAGGNPPVAAILLTLIWISVFIRNQEMFLEIRHDKAV